MNISHTLFVNLHNKCFDMRCKKNTFIAGIDRYLLWCYQCYTQKHLNWQNKMWTYYNKWCDFKYNLHISLTFFVTLHEKSQSLKMYMNYMCFYIMLILLMLHET
jgi:hypothetical protein